jgi:hypothetical protein
MDFSEDEINLATALAYLDREADMWWERTSVARECVLHTAAGSKNPEKAFELLTKMIKQTYREGFFNGYKRASEENETH